MILLLGGTSETADIAEALAEKGNDVLVSNCTDTPVNIGTHPRITGRTGALDAAAMRDLVAGEAITCVVDATHPYAVQVSETAVNVCRETMLPYHRFERPGVEIDNEQIHAVTDHQEAAIRACSSGRVILLTTGSRNLETYVTEAKKRQCELFVRVLPCSESLERCRRLGIPEENVIAERGPFSVEENESVIVQYGIDVLVTKDSGQAGGVPEKLEAAKRCGCQVVLVERPAQNPAGAIHSTVESLLLALERNARFRRMLDRTKREKGGMSLKQYRKSRGI